MFRGGGFPSWLPQRPWGKQSAKFTTSIIHCMGHTGCAFAMAVHWLEEILCVDRPEIFGLKKSKRKTKEVVYFSAKLFISVLYGFNLWTLL